MGIVVWELGTRTESSQFLLASFIIWDTNWDVEMKFQKLEWKELGFASFGVSKLEEENRLVIEDKKHIELEDVFLPF